MFKQSRNEFNYSLFLPIFLFYLLSIILQYLSALSDNNDVKYIITKQVVFCFLSFICILIIRWINTSFLMKHALLFYILSLFIMALLYWFYDPYMFSLTSTKRWLKIGSFSFQPSELVKIFFILFMVRTTIIYESTHVVRTLKTDLKYILQIFSYSTPTFFLMFTQKDFGTSLVFIAIVGALFIISGVNWKLILTITLTSIAVGITLVALVFNDRGNELLYSLHFKPYQLDRVRAWVDPFQFKDSISFQQIQGLQSIISGGMFGTGAGLRSSIYVPVRESDMIFTVVSEYFGFLGGSSVIFLYFYLFYQMISSALNTKIKAYVYITVSFVFSLLFQIFENIGATIGLLPLTGIPLPFLSQGGTSLIVLGMGFGIIMGLRSNKSDF